MMMIIIMMHDAWLNTVFRLLLGDLDSWVIQTAPPPIQFEWLRDYCVYDDI